MPQGTRIWPMGALPYLAIPHMGGGDPPVGTRCLADGPAPRRRTAVLWVPVPPKKMGKGPLKRLRFFHSPDSAKGQICPSSGFPWNMADETRFAHARPWDRGKPRPGGSPPTPPHHRHRPWEAQQVKFRGKPPTPPTSVGFPLWLSLLCRPPCVKIFFFSSPVWANQKDLFHQQ